MTRFSIYFTTGVFSDMKKIFIPAILSLMMLFCFAFELSPAYALDDIPQYRTRSDPGCHTEGIYPATVRIRNQEETSGYSVDICVDNETIFYAPRVVLQPGFKAERGSRFRAGVPVIDVHVVILEECATYPDYPGCPSPPNPNPGTCFVAAGRHFIHPQDMEREILLLNSSFYTINGDQLVRFRLKSVTEWSQVVSAGLTGDDLVHYITDNSHTYGDPDEYGHAMQRAFNRTPNTISRDHHALNFYVYNSGHTDMGANTGHGRNNSDKPYILIDYDRWGSAYPQHPVGHEMGHAFGLGHTCSEEVANVTDPSNIMGSRAFCGDACAGALASLSLSGGDRSLGFEFDPYIDCSTCQSPPCFRKDQESGKSYGQAEIVLWNAAEIAKALGLINGSLPIRVP